MVRHLLATYSGCKRHGISVLCQYIQVRCSRCVKALVRASVVKQLLCQIVIDERSDSLGIDAACQVVDQLRM